MSGKNENRLSICARAVGNCVAGFLAASLIIAGVSAQSQSPHDDAALQAGIREFEAKHYQEAKSVLEKVIATEPSNATAAFYLGRVAFEQNNADLAVRWLETAVRFDNKSSAHHHWLAQAYGMKAQTGSLLSRPGFAGKARDELLKSVELDSNNIDARSDLARYYDAAPGFLGGSEQRAMEQVEFIKRKDALQGWLLAGELLEDKKKYPDAERALLEAEKF